MLPTPDYDLSKVLQLPIPFIACAKMVAEVVKVAGSISVAIWYQINGLSIVLDYLGEVFRLAISFITCAEMVLRLLRRLALLGLGSGVRYDRRAESMHCWGRHQVIGQLPDALCARLNCRPHRTTPSVRQLRSPLKPRRAFNRLDIFKLTIASET